ncbi:MAG: hypothetical protein ACK4LQ_05585 [Pararhodobacter sp.]
MSDTNQAPSQAPASARRAQRQERQARVGILRNPNRPPLPPARKAALMGKWPRLRSSRRPTNIEAELEAAVASDVQAHAASDSGAMAPPGTRHDAAASAETRARGPAAPIVTQNDDQVTGIDIAGLMDSVRDIGRSASTRKSYAADLRAAEADLGPLNSRATETPAASRPRAGDTARAGASSAATTAATQYSVTDDDAPPQPVRNMPLRVAILAGAALAILALTLLLG